LAYLGSLLDASRYKKLDEQDAMTRGAYALKQIGTALLSQSFLSSLGDFFGGLADDRVPRTPTRFSGLARTSSSVLVPNLVKQLDRLFDPTLYDARTVTAAFMRDLPVARQGLDPAINVLGDPVRPDLNPFFSRQRTDDLWQTLAARQLWISVPNRTTMLRDRPMTPDEYYAFTRERGRWLKERLTEPRALARLKTLPPEAAEKYLNTYERAASEVAKATILKRAP
jgi:hypothetical protein